MYSFLLILLTSALTALIIWFLHKNHIQKTLELAEKNDQLAPLTPPRPQNETRAALGVLEELGKNPQTSQSWSEEIKSLRDAGAFKEALALSKRQYPRMLAFKQTLITLRAGIRQEPTHSAQYLNDLYQTAILGDLSKVKSSNAETITAIKLKLSEHGDPQNYWNVLGYKNLRLLTKTDCKLLSKHWGEPMNHSSLETLVTEPVTSPVLQ